jgi:hypothetical protein
MVNNAEELNKIKIGVAELLDGAANLEVESKDDYDMAMAQMGRCYEQMETVDKVLRPEIDELFKKHRAATAEYNALIKPIKEAIGLFKTKTAEFLLRAKAALEKEAAAGKAKLEAAGINTELITTNTGMNAVKDLANQSGMSLVEEWGYEIVNPALLPREYLMPDLKKIAARVKSMKSEANIPGVKVIKTATLRRMGGC